MAFLSPGWKKAYPFQAFDLICVCVCNLTETEHVFQVIWSQVPWRIANSRDSLLDPGEPCSCKLLQQWRHGNSHTGGGDSIHNDTGFDCLTCHNLTPRNYSSPTLIGMLLLPNKCVLFREVSCGEREDHMHS